MARIKVLYPTITLALLLLLFANPCYAGDQGLRRYATDTGRDGSRDSKYGSNDSGIHTDPKALLQMPGHVSPTSILSPSQLEAYTEGLQHQLRLNRQRDRERKQRARGEEDNGGGDDGTAAMGRGMFGNPQRSTSSTNPNGDQSPGEPTMFQGWVAAKAAEQAHQRRQQQGQGNGGGSSGDGRGMFGNPQRSTSSTNPNGGQSPGGPTVFEGWVAARAAEQAQQRSKQQGQEAYSEDDQSQANDTNPNNSGSRGFSHDSTLPSQYLAYAQLSDSQHQGNRRGNSNDRGVPKDTGDRHASRSDNKRVRGRSIYAGRDGSRDTLDTTDHGNQSEDPNLHHSLAKWWTKLITNNYASLKKNYPRLTQILIAIPVYGIVRIIVGIIYRYTPHQLPKWLLKLIPIVEKIEEWVEENILSLGRYFALTLSASIVWLLRKALQLLLTCVVWSFWLLKVIGLGLADTSIGLWLANTSPGLWISSYSRTLSLPNKLVKSFLQLHEQL